MTAQNLIEIPKYNETYDFSNDEPEEFALISKFYLTSITLPNNDIQPVILYNPLYKKNISYSIDALLYEDKIVVVTYDIDNRGSYKNISWYYKPFE